MNGNEILMLWSDARRVKYDKIQLGLSSIKKKFGPVFSAVRKAQETNAFLRIQTLKIP